MDLRHEQRDRESHVLDDLREHSYWAYRDLARIEHSAPTGCLDAILHPQRAIATRLFQAIDGLTSTDPAVRAETEITVVADLLRDEHGERKDSTSRSARAAVRAFIDNSGGFELVEMSPRLIESARDVLPERLAPTPDADTIVFYPGFRAKPGGLSF